ncbi:MAG: nitrogen regulation protein NR(I) [Halieaceae bacterium MED-G27]|jgi:two-component system nitrogen regulation response regulator GlnG|nr:nitrogen regulation protein NR(I) [Halieaceae bacterium]OUT67539.1 MAG: nitrogen regulation protein NR(I) [Cellvibrionales bacterium TMED21]PDH37283.1 MAG: nitrogen regulation protein NR(I) [Halieaceae bacterium MED-G27]|tara:strand:- start:13973 stop:15367 length:1395 start_codon:yes stop_codon:yes gene_type:complete
MKTDQEVWVVDDDKSIRKVIELALEQENIAHRSFANAATLLEELKEQHPSAIISDIRMPGMDGIELLARLQQDVPHIPVVITTAHSDLDSAVTSYEGGAFEYLPKPFDIDEMLEVTQRAMAHVTSQPVADSDDANSKNEIIGNAPAMQEVFRAIGRLSQSSITVLINGQSGTGKELVARALHRHSPRSTKPFVALNMAAIPKDLMESELFGHEKGAFTGATGRREGRFEQANGGTLFLDEIGDMPAETQTRLLRVLAEGEFYRVGGMSAVQTDVRVIAATHQDLSKLVASGQFREDLFHRLNVIKISVPALAERREDIPALLTYFLERSADELGVARKQLAPSVTRVLSELPWPGNVRQLENTCRWLTVMAAGNTIIDSDLPEDLLLPSEISEEVNSANWGSQLASWARRQLSSGETQVLRKAIPQFEQIMIDAALEHTGGRKAEAAELLGWGRNTLTRKLSGQ